MQAAYQLKYNDLRTSFPFFVFERFSYEIGDTLKVEYFFNCSDKHFFKPNFELSFSELKHIKPDIQLLENLLFHIGMVELLSYWKATCSPLIIIKPYHIDEDQIAWWKKIYFNGLGEFFYLNGIQACMEDFVIIKSESSIALKKSNYAISNTTLVPVGGGKDSAVTLDILKRAGIVVRPFVVNSRAACAETIENADIPASYIIHISRIIDPVLIELNSKGYLNGHTPFSALLAFMSSMTAMLIGSKHIALSNESSANEPTVKDTEINHQYSKSYNFENDFRNYLHTYITGTVNYFSFLRPISELQIARLFAQRKQYHNAFKSCNAGSKSNSWCGVCPKCLFTFIILLPFISMENLIKIYGKNLLDDIKLEPYFCELTGISEVKPFECVGTVAEVLVCINYLINHTTEKLPLLIAKYKDYKVFNQVGITDFNSILNEYREQHFLIPEFNSILKDAIYS